MERAVVQFLESAAAATDVTDINIAAGTALEEIEEVTREQVASRAYKMVMLYGTSVAMISAALLIMGALRSLEGVFTYSPLIAAIAVVVLIAGLGPALVSILVGWAGSLTIWDEPEVARWATSLGVVLAMTLAFCYLQKRRPAAAWRTS